MGSYENKYWQKNWKETKRSLSLDTKQKSVLVGSMLGDGTLQVGKGAVNANFKTEQGLEQKKYVWWKYKIFRPWVFTPPKISYRYTENRIKYPKSLWFRTVRHPLITKFHQLFYRDGKKIIPSNVEELLDPLALAVWIMDDGHYGKITRIIDISTYCFNLEEIRLLQNAIWKRFGIAVRYHSDRDKGYRLYFNQPETSRVISIIYPHIAPSMLYKIGFRNPVTTGSHVSYT